MWETKYNKSKIQRNIHNKSNGTIKTKAIKEAAREIDTNICKSMYTKLKLKEMCNICYIKAYNVFVKSKVITAMIKYAYGINLHRVKISIINNNECGNKCP